MEDVFDVLVEDHEEIRQVLDELEKGPTAATGATEDQLMLRTIMTEELVIEAAKHEEIELACLWPAVREHVPGGDALADRAVCAELEIVSLLTELDQLDATRPEFEHLLDRFTQAAREHFDFEERQVWPRLRCAINSGALAPRAAAELGRRVLLARQRVPVRPGSRASAPSEWPQAPRCSQWPGESAHFGSFG
jgi:Hemerythrin HHE cation binding domain